jgi:SAM-dependent methyltransferase
MAAAATQSFIYVLGIVFILACIQYLILIVSDRAKRRLNRKAVTEEGFEGVSTEAEKAGIRWLNNEELYDSFYASVYDQLVQGSVRNQAEVALLSHDWTRGGIAVESLQILDVGCGTGIAATAFAKLGVAKVIALDKSAEMIRRAKTITLDSSTLTPEQKGKIEWRIDDMTNPSACAGGEVSHACILYFSLYYIKDKEQVFRNLFVWVKPGGRLAVQVVNKHKFDPMLESASPWLAFSLQKYSDKRITRSEVIFDKFTYSGEFNLMDPDAEFRETFKFKDGSVRHQRHMLRMEDMNEIVALAKTAGWEYLGFTDLTPIGFEYSYHLNFKHP